MLLVEADTLGEILHEALLTGAALSGKHKTLNY